MDTAAEESLHRDRGALGALPGSAPPAAGVSPTPPPSAARKRVWMVLTNGGIALALRYLVQVDTLSFLVLVPLLVYCVCRFWDWLRVAMATAPRDFWSLYQFIYVRCSLALLERRRLGTLEQFERTLRRHPLKACFVFERATWTFADVAAYSDALAVELHESLALRAGNVVHVLLENRPEYACVWLALAKLGVVAALVNTNLRRDSLLHCLRAASSRALIYDASLASAVREVLDELPSEMHLYHLPPASAQSSPAAEASALPGRALQPLIEQRRAAGAKPPARKTPTLREPLLYIYTSGTTGLPKAAIISHSRFYYYPTMIRRMMRVRASDVLYTPLPLYHTAGGLLGIGQALLYGNTVVLRRKFSASQFWDDCKLYQCTAAQYIGEIARYLLAQPVRAVEREHRVRLVFGNGLRAQIWHEFLERFGVEQIGEFYGATEGNANVVNNDNHPGAVGFCSRILPQVYPVRLIRVDDRTREPLRDARGMCVECKPGEPGELVGKIVKGNPLREFDGYVNRGDSEKKIVRNVFTAGDMAFLTGDLLVMDEYGYLYFVDRTGDTFRWKGENVSTAEVEYVVARVLHMNDVVVYGVEIPRAEGRAGMAAIVSSAAGVDLELLARELAQRLPQYARPLFVRLVDAIDDTGTFKLKKNDLRVEAYDPQQVARSAAAAARTRRSRTMSGCAEQQAAVGEQPRADRLFYLDVAHNEYKPITQEVFEQIKAGRIKF